MPKPTKRLGRGLASLVTDMRTTEGPSAPEDRGPAVSPSPSQGEPTIRLVAVEALAPNPFQPREIISEAGLISLAESLRNSGMIQPLSARQTAGQLQIITGERRWRAAKLAGIRNIPVVVRDVGDREMLEMALVENLQREDLNAIDRARAYRQYCDRFGLTAEAVAQRLGEDRTTVTNYLRLLELDDEIRGMVAQGRLSMGHARCIVGLPDPGTRLRLAKAVVAHELSVRALEEIARREKRGRDHATAPPEARADQTAHVRDIEERFSLATRTKVTIQQGRRKDTGRIVIEYYSLDDFDRIAALLEVPPER